MICATNRHKIKAFSLVEVVVALGVFVFAGFALIGLLSVGIQSNRDSKEQLQAANILEYICATRRAAPTANLTALYFPLPVLSTTGATSNNFTSPAYLSWDGTTTNQGSATFGFLYNINAPANYVAKVNPGTATVYLCVYWPAGAPVTGASGHVEVTSSFALP